MPANLGPMLRTMTDQPPQAPAYPPLPAVPVDLATLVATTDFEAPAAERLHPLARAYIEGGSFAERTLRDNLAIWDRYRLRPRVLADVASIDLTTTVLGRPTALPLGVAPAALHGLAHPEGELATARAAANAGAINVLSTMSSHSIEAVAEAAPHGRRWFQLYVQPDPALTRELVERAAAAGYEALCLTVDVPVLGYRDEIVRHRFDPGPGAYANLVRRGAWGRGNELEGALDSRAVRLTWDSLAEIRSWAPVPRTRASRVSSSPTEARAKTSCSSTRKALCTATAKTLRRTRATTGNGSYARRPTRNAYRLKPRH